MKNKLILLVVLLTLTASSSVSDVGIKFFKGTYAEAVAKAKSEKKMIFIDFFTEWCGR